MVWRHHVEFERFALGIGDEPSVVEDDAAAVVGRAEQQAMVVVLRLRTLAGEPLPIRFVLLRCGLLELGVVLPPDLVAVVSSQTL